MPQRRYDAVICDIDGCLVAEDTSPFDLPRLAQVAEHNRRAISGGDWPVVTLCSGRPQPFAECICRLIANTELPIVCENGTWLWHPAQNLYDMDPAIRPEHIQAVRDAEDWVREQLGPRGVRLQPGKHAALSLYHDDTGFLRSLVPMVEKAVSVCGWPLRISMTWYYINCDLAHISKGTGVDRVTAMHGLERDRLAAIGDTSGDLFLRDRVGFFACPANAAEEVKAVADYVAEREQAAGVLEILERLR